MLQQHKHQLQAQDQIFAFMANYNLVLRFELSIAVQYVHACGNDTKRFFNIVVRKGF